MPKANIIITQEDDGLWVIRRGKRRLVLSPVDVAFRWKYETNITIDDQVCFLTSELTDVLMEVSEHE